MNKIYFKRALLAIGATLALTIGLAVPAGAGGDSTLRPGLAQLSGGPCGGSYTHVGHYALPNAADGSIDGYLDVYWSSSSRRNCLVVNHAGNYYGKYSLTTAKIKPSGYSWPPCNSVGCDRGYYAYYAGPVYTPFGVDMTHRCIDIYGIVNANAGRIFYGLHCG
jgi:hypothetical protein